MAPCRINGFSYCCLNSLDLHLRCLEKVKHVLTDGGLMVISHGKTRKTSQKKKSKLQLLYTPEN